MNSLKIVKAIVDTFALVIDNDEIHLSWTVVRVNNGEWYISADTFLVDGSIVSNDIKIIESTLRESFPNAYHWRRKGYEPAYAFTDAEATLFRLQYCGDRVKLY